MSKGDLGLGREDRGMLGYHSYSFLDQGGGLRFLEVFCDAYRPFQAFPAFSPQQGVGKGEPIVWKEEADKSFPSLPAPATRQQEGSLSFLLVCPVPALAGQAGADAQSWLLPPWSMPHCWPGRQKYLLLQPFLVYNRVTRDLVSPFHF